MATRTQDDLALIAHLLRRAGFGASYEALQAYAAQGYEATVEELLRPEAQPLVEEDLMLRLNAGWQNRGALEQYQTYWVYRMINTKRPLEEKIALFWHGVHCTGQAKLDNSRQMGITIDMFRRAGLDSFRNLLIQLAKDPGMIWYLDNCMSHKGAINENWGRELLELFSMGVGNYTEEDVQQASRAFCGWTNAPTYPNFPNGRVDWQFFYDPTDHDNAEKAFLGQKGKFNGDDVIDVICQQPATARFVARHLYNFFVADESPVPQWGNTPPRDPQAIETLVDAYFQHDCDIRSILRVLFNSNFFKEARFSRIKNPVEAVVGAMRMVREYPIPKPGFYEVALECRYMGQDLLNPPTVEGWHTGDEWIDSGTLVERINFVAKKLGDSSKPGVNDIVNRLAAQAAVLTPEAFVDGCLQQLGALAVHDETRRSLIAHVQRGGEIQTQTPEFADRTGVMLQLIASTKEYQFC